ncbi:predicted protein [Naegleria gruberi]|uniref:Predicted protein n=1 Tax=Naegleria gruberi TaxID=5762 RepID=D2W0U1_NAEGR|nr:uncharacterized protein NAEGRDRAFT_74980 [Naegleria gruberi]EFC37398.1 predicted protein [Naegleria gruberi]|eukprot:XP_002670142.1 predicted protein [Naegleria gruberi strain NEG-M]
MIHNGRGTSLMATNSSSNSNNSMIPVLRSPKVPQQQQPQIDYFKFNTTTSSSTTSSASSPLRTGIPSSQSSSRSYNAHHNSSSGSTNGYLEPLSPASSSSTVPQTFGKYINLPSFSTLSSSNVSNNIKKSPNNNNYNILSSHSNNSDSPGKQFSRSALNSITNYDSRSNDSDEITEDEFLNGTSNSVEGAGSKIKFADLGSKISAIDAQVAQQEKVRKKRQMQIESIESKIDNVNTFTNKVNSRVDSTNGALEKLETQLFHERGNRERGEKNITNLIEEKFNQLSSRIEQEKNARIQENESVKKRLKNLEEQVSTVHLNIESLSQELSSQSNQLHLLSTNFNSFLNQYKTERKQLADSIISESKETQIKFTDVKQKINNMELDVQKQISTLSNLSNAHINEITTQLEKLFTEIGTQTRQSTDPIWSKLEQIQNTLESQKINTAHQFNNVQQLMNAQKMEILSEFIQPTSDKLERLIIQNDKQSKKNLFDLRADIEKQQELVNSSLNKLQDRIVSEEKVRGEGEANLLALLSKTMSRIKKTIESPSLINEAD